MELVIAVNINNNRCIDGFTNTMFLDSCYTRENENTIKKLWKVRKKLTENVYSVLDNPYSMYLNEYLDDIYANLSEIEYIINTNYNSKKDTLNETIYNFLAVSGIDAVKRLDEINIDKSIKRQIINKHRDIENIKGGY